MLEKTMRADALSPAESQLMQPAARPAEALRPLRVFVHLARNKDAREWRAAREAGKLVGFNDDTPYGYGRAERMGCEIVFSHSGREGPALRLVRLAFRALLGFDLVHAFRQGSAMRAADIVWTHTESQYLAVAATLLIRGGEARILGQTVWLMDRWFSLGAVRRALYRRLIDRVDVLTFHSPANRARAALAFPSKRTVLVPFGIPSEATIEPRPRAAHPARILSLGNDAHRDWTTLIAAVRGEPDLSLVILSGNVPADLARGADNVEIRLARSQAELMRSFEEATLVCVPLKPNLHASGITVMQEAALAGVPIIATRTGGLDAYFSEDEVCFVPAGDAKALRQGLLESARNPEAALARARRAQARMKSGALGAEAYIRQHVALSREILQR